MVAEIEAKIDQYIEDSKDERERWAKLLDAQLKGMSIEQAEDAVSTQAAANVTQEVIRQEGAEKAAAAKPAQGTPNVAQPKLPSTNPTTEEAIDLLGLTG